MPGRIAIVMGLLLMTVAAFAQIPTAGNVFVGYSLNHAQDGWTNAANLNGWEASVEGKIAPFVGIVLDAGTQYGTLQIPAVHITNNAGLIPTTSRVETLMVGPRVSMSVGKFRPFAHALLGYGHLHEDASSLQYVYAESCLVDAIGGGLDYRVIPHVALRLQGDALQTRFRGGRQTDARVAVGAVLKF